MDEELTASVKYRCQQRLGDHVDRLDVAMFDHDCAIAVCIACGGWRHAVTGETRDARADPVMWADHASDMLLARIAARRMC